MAKIFTLEGKGLKLDTAADVEPHIASLRAMEDVEEVRLLGNTLGVEACEALGALLETKKTLKVRYSSNYIKLTALSAAYDEVLTSSDLGCQPGRHIYWTST